MAALFKSADLVVLPSYREGLPKSLIEAAACGLPLVTCNTPGCREVVTDGVDGLLVPPRDAVALAGAIERLLAGATLRTRLGRAARARALAEFGEKIVIEKTLAVYQELLGGHPRLPQVAKRSGSMGPARGVADAGLAHALPGGPPAQTVIDQTDVFVQATATEVGRRYCRLQ